MVPVAAADSCGRTATRSCDKMTKTTKAVNMIQDQGAIPSQRAAVIVVQKIFVALASDPHNIGATHSDGCLYSRMFVEESVQSQVGLHRQKKKKDSSQTNSIQWWNHQPCPRPVFGPESSFKSTPSINTTAIGEDRDHVPRSIFDSSSFTSTTVVEVARSISCTKKCGLDQLLSAAARQHLLFRRRRVLSVSINDQIHWLDSRGHFILRTRHCHT